MRRPSRPSTGGGGGAGEGAAGEGGDGDEAARLARLHEYAPAAALDLAALPAGDYLVSVDAYGDASGTFRLDRTTGPAEPLPANDLCDQAIVLTLVDGVAHDARGSTRRAADDLHPADCRDWAAPLPLAGADVVYAVDVPADGVLTATVTPEAGYDVALYALAGCAAERCLAASDRSLLGGGSESVVVQNTSGRPQRMLLVVDGWRAGATGRFSLEARIALP